MKGLIFFLCLLFCASSVCALNSAKIQSNYTPNTLFKESYSANSTLDWKAVNVPGVDAVFFASYINKTVQASPASSYKAGWTVIYLYAGFNKNPNNDSDRYYGNKRLHYNSITSNNQSVKLEVFVNTSYFQYFVINAYIGQRNSSFEYENLSYIGYIEGSQPLRGNDTGLSFDASVNSIQWNTSDYPYMVWNSSTAIPFFTYMPNTRPVYVPRFSISDKSRMQNYTLMEFVYTNSTDTQPRYELRFPSFRSIGAGSRYMMTMDENMTVGAWSDTLITSLSVGSATQYSGMSESGINFRTPNGQFLVAGMGYYDYMSGKYTTYGYYAYNQVGYSRAQEAYFELANLSNLTQTVRVGAYNSSILIDTMAEMDLDTGKYIYLRYPRIQTGILVIDNVSTGYGKINTTPFGVTASGTSCTITNITKGIITGATCS